MSEIYDLSNYTSATVPTAYPRDVRSLVDAGVALGWTLHITRDGAMRLVSFDKVKTIQLNTRKGSHPLEQYRRIIKRHANPLLAPVAEHKRAEQRAEQMMGAFEKRANTETAKTTDPVVDKIVEKLYGDDEVDPATVVVYEGPMRSRGSTGSGLTLYQSDIATEVEYGDGRRVLTCVRCGWSVENTPRSMSGHWQKHVREDERLKGGHEGPKAEDTGLAGSGYKPTQERLDSLKEALIEALGSEIDWSDIDGAAERLALKALIWDHERRMSHGDQEPLTDAQILDRIRRLVDGGKYAERMEEIQAMRETINDMQTLLDQVTTERDKAREYVNTLRELLNEEA